DTLEQMANIQVLNRGAAAVPPMAAPALATAAINAPAAAAAGYSAYRSPVGQCGVELIKLGIEIGNGGLPEQSSLRDLGEQYERNRTAIMQRDTRPRPKIPDILICRR
ncbi:hypothetical protein, partial [Vreelandella stevensii]|uniref:hypothetical protein n=1 Tax=Vreelandella stevensii TaxID=502821 RepID=UPI00374A0F29